MDDPSPTGPGPASTVRLDASIDFVVETFPDPALCERLTAYLPEQGTPDDPELGVHTLVAIDNLRAALATYRQRVVDRMHETMPRDTTIVTPWGGASRAWGKERKGFAKHREALVSAVLASQRVDRETGEILAETDYDKLRHVWNLGDPRTKALTDRGIDPDEFCEVENGPLQIKIIPAETREVGE
jgi:hypothetical protein